MLLYLPLRKVLKCLTKKRTISRQERSVSSLTECLLKENKQAQRKRYLQITLTLTILVILSLKTMIQFQRSPDDSPEFDNEQTTIYKDTTAMCSINITFGKILINKLITENSLKYTYPTVRKGGYYMPSDCQPRHKVAILVPYRDRELHLRIFLYNIHPFLMQQKLEYRIFIIEQAGADLFNRGRIFNAGFTEAMKLGKWHCVILHDVDLLPLDDRILYTCPIWPRNMCTTIVEQKDPTFRTLTGGVSAIDVRHFRKINGFSNYYWGWGGEDDDMYRRLRDAGIPVTKYDKRIAHYTSLRHVKQTPNKDRYRLLSTAIKRSKKDGISSLKYKVVSIVLQHLYTQLIIDINPNKENLHEIYFN